MISFSVRSSRLGCKDRIDGCMQSFAILKRKSSLSTFYDVVQQTKTGNTQRKTGSRG